MPATEDVTVRVEPADPPGLRETGDGLAEALRPDGTTDVESITEPAKPFKLVSWTDDVPEEPANIVMDCGLAEMVKSTTLTVTCTEWERDPMVPATVTV